MNAEVSIINLIDYFMLEIAQHFANY